MPVKVQKSTLNRKPKQAPVGVSNVARDNILKLARPDFWARNLKLKVDGHDFDIKGREYIIPVIRDNSDWIVIPKAAQMCFTISFLVRTFHWIVERRWNHLYLLPVKTGTTTFVQGRVDPIIDSSPELKELFQSTDNLRHKQTVENINLYIRGTNIKSELKEVPVDVQVRDERDEMNEDNMPEADARMDGSVIRKVVELSTPTAPGHGVDAEDAWHDSDQHLWNVPCPHCGRFQVLIFDENVKLGNRADEAVCECSSCHKEISDRQRGEMNALGYWEPTDLNGNLRGYHISQLNSSTQKLEEFLKNYYAGQTDSRRLKAFHNNQLGEPFVSKGDQFTIELLDSCIVSGHRLGGIPGGQVFVGVDVGTVLTVKASYKDRHDRRVAWQYFIYNTWDQLDKFLDSLINFVCVIDAHPEKRNATDLAIKYPNKVFIGFEQDRQEQVEVAVFHKPKNRGESGEVKIDRTSAFDSVINSYMTGNVILPFDARELGENMPRLAWNGFYHQMIQMVRVEEEDTKGRIVARWKKNKNKDHWHHADMFEFVASLYGGHLYVPADIQQKFSEAGGITK